jgi:two-component system response regulator MprA
MSVSIQPESVVASTFHAYVLLVEDEPAISGFVRRGLIFEGFEVDVAINGHIALEMIRDRQPDLLILDRMLPEVDGLEVTRRLRTAEAADNQNRLPILMLTARDSVADRVAGLDAGADDYLVKPFDFNELLARVRALLRRTATSTPIATGEIFNYADVHLDTGSRVVHRGNREIELTPREFDLLALFLRNPNQVLTRTMLMQRVWGEDFFGESNVLEVVIGNVRRALEDNGESRLIQTVRGIGYVLRQR